MKVGSPCLHPANKLQRLQVLVTEMPGHTCLACHFSGNSLAFKVPVYEFSVEALECSAVAVCIVPSSGVCCVLSNTAEV